jgi:hypothetical protein
MPEVPDAAEQLARVADVLASRHLPPRRFLRGLAWNCASVRPDVRGLFDLMGGGGNRFRGRGFRRRFDDGTDGQARHFAGIAVSPLLLGEVIARFAARRVLRDPADSADGRLSEAAFEFSRQIRTGSLPVSEAGDWIRRHIAV